jgi:AcrR family transcriptional regulator
LTKIQIWSYSAHEPVSATLHSPRDRAARAERILDATAELLLGFGYRRVTNDDVARQADIGKGTIYLHWKTSADLFRAVFDREALTAIDGLRRDPSAWRPHRLARCLPGRACSAVT